jgi:formylglycine-generating enzyme required for sulfatase activity
LGAARRRSHLRILGILAGIGVLHGCAKSKPEREADVAVSAPSAQLRFELPLGATVRVDGAATSQLEPSKIVVEPGHHAVEITNVCGDTSRVEVEVAPGATVDVTPTPPWKTTTLGVHVTTPKGHPADLLVKLSDHALPAAGKPVMVSACTQRLHVTAKDWGGFMEDIELAPDQPAVRNIVLALGPDLVRIHGTKRFNLGPPEWADDHIYMDRRPVAIDTFDLDRTEVTTAQYRTCKETGACERVAQLFVATRSPSSTHEPLCTTDVFDESRMPRPGKANFPMNCVAEWEARQYCEWAGKRLPTQEEWEFAARSRNDDYLCPWKQDRDTFDCRASSTKALQEVCASPEWSSEQGVCDLMSGVQEYVEAPPYGAHKGLSFGPDGDPDPLVRPFPLDRPQQFATVGFRCARDVRKEQSRP